MPVLESAIDPKTDFFMQNKKAMEQQVELMRSRFSKIQEGGGQEAIQRHKARGKMTARERIQKLIDPGSSFLELSSVSTTKGRKPR